MAQFATPSPAYLRSATSDQYRNAGVRFIRPPTLVIGQFDRRSSAGVQAVTQSRKKQKKSSLTEDELDEDLSGYLASKTLDEDAQYVARGRMHRQLSKEELIAKWAAAFRRMADEPLDRCLRSSEEDLAAELRLRGIEPPYKSMGKHFERWKAAAVELIEQLRHDPQRFEEIGRGLADEVEEFKSVRDKSKN
jgi:hypothetical protein